MKHFKYKTGFGDLNPHFVAVWMWP